MLGDRVLVCSTQIHAAIVFSNQHMLGLELAAEICKGRLEGCFVNSMRVSFDPHNVEGGEYECDVKTAGYSTFISHFFAVP